MVSTFFKAWSTHVFKEDGTSLPWKFPVPPSPICIAVLILTLATVSVPVNVIRLDIIVIKVLYVVSLYGKAVTILYEHHSCMTLIIN